VLAARSWSFARDTRATTANQKRPVEARRKLGILPDPAGRHPACPFFLRSRLAKKPTSKMLVGRDSLEGYPPAKKNRPAGNFQTGRFELN